MRATVPFSQRCRAMDPAWTALTLVLGTGTATASPQPAPEIFATNNTAVITNPDDPRPRTHLVRFDAEVRTIVATRGGRTTSSTLLDGVFWSGTLQQTTYERSREFDVRAWARRACATARTRSASGTGRSRS